MLQNQLCSSSIFGCALAKLFPLQYKHWQLTGNLESCSEVTCSQNAIQSVSPQSPKRWKMLLKDQPEPHLVLTLSLHSGQLSQSSPHLQSVPKQSNA